MTILSAVLPSGVKGIAMRVASRLPTLFGWLIRVTCPPAYCRQQLRMRLGTQATFQLADQRPYAALSSAFVAFQNFLPFDVQIKMRRLQISIGDSGYLDAVLNSLVEVRAFSEQNFLLPEAPLSDKQVRWLLALKRSNVRMRVTVTLAAKSAFRSWDQEAVCEGIADVYHE